MATTVPGKLDTNLLDNLFVRPMLCSFLLFLSAIPRALTQATQCTLAHICSLAWLLTQCIIRACPSCTGSAAVTPHSSRGHYCTCVNQVDQRGSQRNQHVLTGVHVGKTSAEFLNSFLGTIIRCYKWSTWIRKQKLRLLSGVINVTTRKIIGMYTLPDQEASFPNPNFSRRALLRAFTWAGVLIGDHHSPACSEHITTEYGPASTIVRVDYKWISSLLWQDNQSTDINPKKGTETNIVATRYWSNYHTTIRKQTHAHVFVRHNMTNMVKQT
jgi:hypothetical protein